MATNGATQNPLQMEVVAGASVPPALPAVPPQPPSNQNGGNGSPETHPIQSNSNKFKKGGALAVSILTQTGSGFGVGAMLARGNQAGVSGLVALASFIFAGDVALRYIPEAVKDRNPLWWWLGGTLLLSAMALIPYNVIKSTGKGKGKSAAAAIPTMASAWTFAALLLTYLVARGGQINAALQGSIISIMYMALSSLAGYNMQGKNAGMGAFAAALWGLLLIFDVLGFTRS